MRPFVVLASVLALATPALRAALAPDPALTAGLQSCLTNGLESGIRLWYSDRPALATEMKDNVLAAAKNLGDIIDTEVVAIQPISKRVTRYYVAIYFTRAPLWVRIERYANADKAFFLPLKLSLEPDDILPGYLTDFQP